MRSPFSLALNGVRVCHVNSTGFGSGVAELLSRQMGAGLELGSDSTPTARQPAEKQRENIT
ncbi:MAG: hypothetical protein A2Y95_10970 [Deltaproteobacteria bacterium RBG_13_65_10]|nr:MAG: hypothetical protein A2Y95_10970 [Deltaproteobacteria bacterium RBG_13_65_10]